MTWGEVQHFAPALNRLGNELPTIEVEASFKELIKPLPVVHGWLHDNVNDPIAEVPPPRTAHPPKAF